MEASLEVSRWCEAPRGVGYRRWTIMVSGLRHLFRTRLFILLLTVAWMGGIVMATIGFLLTQSIASGGWLETLAEQLGARAEATVTAIGGLIVLFPDICIGGLFTLIFWLHSFLALSLCLVALTVLVPRLIANDRASNALTIYLSRPLTSADYLLGKLGTIVGVLVLLWTGPLLFGWVLSMLLAPDRDFIVYSFSPFLHALGFNAIALVALAAIALGVSALNRSARPTVIVWMALWLVAGFVAGFPATPAWLRRASFSYNLGEVRKTVFRLDSALADAGANLPLLTEEMTQNLNRAAQNAQAHDFNGALMGLAVLAALSSAIFLRKLRPE